MPITRSGSRKTIRSWIDERFDVLDQRIIQAFHNVGLQAVSIARRSHRYKDQTGNLTSSIGYVIVQDGQIVEESRFKSVSVKPDKQNGIAGGDGKIGSESGRKYAEELAKENRQGTFLIIVAGMPYAEYVEAKGLNVLDSAKVYANADIKNKINSVLKRFVR